MKNKSTSVNRFIKGSFILALSISALFSRASNGNEAVIETEKTIKQHVKFPNLIIPVQKTERVEVIFTTTESGKVSFVLAKTNNAELKKAIEKQFGTLTLNRIKPNVAHSIVFNFKTL